ncbi:hypothetical protein BYT27DRAFT_7341419 [Phlegmacium glaucopus]|nr:hypothetical protein BYT27DRAFT_7341419 [Phlegmacium glaucopus]
MLDLQVPDPDAAQTMKQMMTYLLTRVEEFTQTVYGMVAVRRIALRRLPCANSVPMELLQQTPQGLIGMEFSRPGPPSRDRILPMSLPRNVRQTHEPRTLLAAECHLHLGFSRGLSYYKFSMDNRKLGESLLLLLSLLYSASHIRSYSIPDVPFAANANASAWRSYELQLLSFASFLYIIWTHTTISYVKNASTPGRDAVPMPSTSSARPASPRLVDGRESRKHSSSLVWNKNNFGYVWMSVPKNYRESSDDGILTGLLLGPLIASSLLLSSLKQMSDGTTVLPAGWLIETPVSLENSHNRLSASQAVLLSRYSLVDLSTFCSTMLLFHVCASWWIEKKCRKDGGKPEGERASVPRSAGLRFWYYIIFTITTSVVIVGLKIMLSIYLFNLWNYLNIFETVIASLFFQFTLYVGLRLAHRGFTLGELGLVCFGGTALCLEFLNLTIARIWPVTTPFIRTYRLPTPLLILQIALIVGSFLTGFLLSPFLLLSRNNAQRPVHRLRFPQEKERNRRYYAVGFYIGSFLIVGGLIGHWARWCLGNRDPWLWVIFRIIEGKKKWSRPALLLYWVLLCIISVAGWNRQLARSRRFRPRNQATAESAASLNLGDAPSMSSATESFGGNLTTTPPVSGPLGMSFPTTFPNISNLPNGANMSNVATDLLDAADKHVPTLGLNARRKFFHGLAVVMFIPGVALDPAFTHLSFSAAFALFTFTEYIRYFAIYPFGASVHLFMNEFLDHRDSGTAILSHFYLLTGCSGSLWLEGPSRLLQFTGILTLGVGDAAASIVGRRLGVHRWSPTTNKTLEGSLAFIISIFASAMLLRPFGYVEPFSVFMHQIDGPSESIQPISESAFHTPLHTESSTDRAHITGYMIQKRSSSRKSNRPSTAPSGDDWPLLPSLHTAPAISLKPLVDVNPSFTSEEDVSRKMQTVLEDDTDISLSFNSIGVSLGDHSFMASSTADKPLSNHSESDCDWATFITVYASGRWDPQKTPNPPKTCQQILSESLRYSCTVPLKSIDSDMSLEALSEICESPRASRENNSVRNSSKTDDRSMSMIPSSSSSGLYVSASPLIKTHLSSLPQLPSSHVMRNSMHTSLPTANQNQILTPSVVNTDLQATVATMRWAAACVDISPLALPSPEHELSDPMRGVMAAIPGSHSQDLIANITCPPNASSNRKSRLMDFWRGTTDIDHGATTHSTSPTQLVTILASPPDTPLATQPVMTHMPTSGSALRVTLEPPTRSNHPIPVALLASAIPASVPAPTHCHGDVVAQTDYFGDVSPLIQPEAALVPPPLISRDDIENTRTGEGTASVPTLPRRVCLTRQTSSPLPVSSPPQAPFVGARLPPNIAPLKLGRAAKEEQMFTALEYLAPPNPPDELERRRALYKFNIWNTGPDMNFDRIAHLAKLVFNTKGVMISLIDSNEQWFKSEWGLKTPRCARAHSFCGHAILQQGDEPTVILDAHRDWRFAKNPLTVGPPHIRFYAGAPLRTQDGFNIGTLAVIDDQPREEFSPRQRHTLKEFAAIFVSRLSQCARWNFGEIRYSYEYETMEQFSRECLEIDTEVHQDDQPDLIVGSSMDRVYDRAAKLVKRTLDVEGVIVMDISHCEVLETMSVEGSVSVTMHHGDPNMDMTKRQLTTEEYHKLNSFFAKYPDGRVSEGIIPISLKPFLPTHVQYALTVPIYNIDKRPFALLCAYNANDHAKRFLEGHELSYLRAIGVIILSAVLKRRMILADKAKGLFISNISHELRTPLHGILAAAELLSESPLSHSQASFLQTVRACGTSLVETVNHVLDFTKLSGNSKSGGVENVIVRTQVDLMQLVEEAIDGCWIGHRARTAMGDSGIGSVYAPPNEDHGSAFATRRKHVETVVDIGYRPEGWSLKCEKGGIRRVLMNLFGNSLKFTSDGYVHVLLRQLPHGDDDPPDRVKVELAVFDTGKGISQNFLKNHLFHPFSQENPLQAGTGLGLAIVNSIITSENVDGTVDVWSEEGVGTEIKVAFLAENAFNGPQEQDTQSFQDVDSKNPLPTVSLVGFDNTHKGIKLLYDTTLNYLTTWWGFEVVNDGDIIILNDDRAPIVAATERRDTSRPFIFLSAARGDPTIMSIASEYERIGGFCRILYKPGGPSRLRIILKLCIHALKIGQSRSPSPTTSWNRDIGHGPTDARERSMSGSSIPRHNTDETYIKSRPGMTPRSSTAHPLPAIQRLLSPTSKSVETVDPDTPVPTITLGSGGTLLRSSVGTLDSERRFRVLVVEDNGILRNLLIKWLSNKGYDFRSAVDGRDGVDVYEKEGPFDVVLLDLSMPVLDGVGATMEIRRLESDQQTTGDSPRARILALTGMSSLEDKRRAFDAGVDGYLVKPVAFKTLDDMFHRLGVS